MTTASDADWNYDAGVIRAFPREINCLDKGSDNFRM
jgi:hypothetical protein